MRLNQPPYILLTYKPLHPAPSPHTGIDDVTPKSELQAKKADIIRANYGKCDEYIGDYKEVRMLQMLL